MTWLGWCFITLDGGVIGAVAQEVVIEDLSGSSLRNNPYWSIGMLFPSSLRRILCCVI